MNSAELVKEIKHDYLMALVENFEPDRLIGLEIGKMKIKVDIELCLS